MQTIEQPILSTSPEPGHAPQNALPLSEMLALLRAEEDYWAEDLGNTSLLFSRVRKIFYDQWGWNSELIRGAAKIEMRYEVKILDDATEHSRPLTRYKSLDFVPKHREVVYTGQDRVFGATRAGQVPFIYQNDHQEVLLPEGVYCDIAHIFAGVDARNHLRPVSPLPPFLFFLKNFFPHVDSNVDIVTWLGDIASSSGDFLFDYLRNKNRPLTPAQEQQYINVDAPGSDMLGDIEPYVIARHYEVGAAQNGLRPTEILTDYFSPGNALRARRATLFCEAVGLKVKADGSGFSNEKQWLAYYKKELRDNLTFQVFSLTDEKLHSVWLPVCIWFGRWRGVLKLDLLLEIFLNSLKIMVLREHVGRMA